MNATKNLSIAFMLVILVASAWSREESKSPLLRANYLSRRPNPLSARGTSSTTSTTAAIPTEEYVDDNGESDEERNDSNEDGSVAPDAEAKVSEEPVSSTEAPKVKPFKVTIRPFRSNDDLLQALKRRRQNFKAAKITELYKPSTAAIDRSDDNSSKPTSSPTTATAGNSERRGRKQFTATKKYFKKIDQKPVEDVAQTVEDIAAVVPTLPSTLARRPVRSRQSVRRN